MKTVRLKLPEHLDVEKIFPFALELDRYALAEEIEIDVGPDRWFPPFAQLFLGMKLKSIRDRNPAGRYGLSSTLPIDHLKRMGFYGLISGQDVSSELKVEDKTTVPITRISKAELRSAEGAQYKEMGDLVQSHSDLIAEVISRDFQHKKEVFDVLSYSIREVIRNCFEHSGAMEVYYCAQFWPTRGKVEVSLADLGQGIRKGLAENPNFRFATDKQAIEMSLMPGVSGKTHQPRRSEVWFNSGYGLYMTNRLARNGGNFVIASGRHGIQLTREKARKTNHQTSFPGTALRLNFDVSQIGNLTVRLEEFRKEGIEMQKLLGNSTSRPPSGISLTLRKDFS